MIRIPHRRVVASIAWDGVITRASRVWGRVPYARAMRWIALVVLASGCSLAFVPSIPSQPPQDPGAPSDAADCPSYVAPVLDGLATATMIAMGAALIVHGLAGPPDSKLEMSLGEPGRAFGAGMLLGATPWLASTIYGATRVHGCRARAR